MTRPPATFVVTVGALALGVGITTAALGRPASAPPAAVRATVVPVHTAVRVCPDPSGQHDREVTTVAAGTSAAVGGSAAPTAGSVEIGRLTGRPSVLVDRAGASAVRSFDRSQPARVLTASGPPAAGVEAVQLSRTDGGPARGLAAVRCGAPGTRFTFTGVGTTVGQDPRLYLTDTDDVPALVDVSIAGPKGTLPTAAGRGIRVEPHAQTVLRLVGLAPDQPWIAVTVDVRSGRAAAALRQTRQQGSTPKGVDWVAPTGPPARSLVLPGLYPHDGRQALTIVDPGQADATVRVEVQTTGGGFVPAGLAAVRVRAGSVRSVALGDAVGGRAAAVRLTSDQPVQATVTTVLAGRSGYADLAVAVATAPVGDVVVPSLPADPARHRAAGVELVAPAGGARVRLTPLTGGRAASRAHPVTVTVKAGTVAMVDAARRLGATAPVGVELTVLPGSGPVHAAAYWYEEGTRGPMLAVVPLVEPPRTVVAPGVRRDPLAAFARAPSP